MVLVFVMLKQENRSMSVAISRLSPPAISGFYKPAIVISGLILVGCSTPETIPDQFEKEVQNTPQIASLPPETLQSQAPQIYPVAFENLPGWQIDRHGDALIAFQKSCQRFATLPGTKKVEALSFTAQMSDWQDVCQQAASLSVLDHQQARHFFEQNFKPYKLFPGAGVKKSGPEHGLFTGYYVPELSGCLRAKPGCQVPVYQKPQDLVSVDLGQFRQELKGKRIAGKVQAGKLTPYADRGAIESGVLSQKGLELLYLKDRTEAFFLHIQGSGRVVLEDGQRVQIGYAAQNGHEYKSIGRELVKRGEMTLSQASMQSIKQWIEAHPQKADDIFAVNKSYVFFRPLTTQGVVGAQGVELTPGRSMAVDRRYIDMGFPVWIDLKDQAEPNGKLQRLMIAQDTGGAIKGVVRGDFFWGYGPEAGARAGKMKSQGASYILVPHHMSVYQ